MCKHMVSFQIVVLNQEVPAECNIVRLRSRAKRKRPKKVTSALNSINFCQTNADEEFRDDELDDEGGLCTSDAAVVWIILKSYFLIS